MDKLAHRGRVWCGIRTVFAATILLMTNAAGVEGACPPSGVVVDLSTLSSPITSATTVGMPTASEQPVLKTCLESEAGEPYATAPAKVYTMTLKKGETFVMRLRHNTFDALQILLHGDVEGDCPGTTQVVCTDTDSEIAQWKNTLDKDQQVYYVLTGFSNSDSGHAILEWNVVPATSDEVPGTCSAPLDLSTLTSPYTVGTTLGMPSLAPRRSAGTECSDADSSSVDSAAMVFSATVQAGQTITLRSLQHIARNVAPEVEAYRGDDDDTDGNLVLGGADSVRELRRGGECPGNTLVKCSSTGNSNNYIRDDTRGTLSWTNTLTEAQTVFYIQYGDDSDDAGLFDLRWNIVDAAESDGTLEGTCTAPIDLARMASPYSSSTLGMPVVALPAYSASMPRCGANTENTESPAKVFTMTVPPGVNFTVTATNNRYNGVHFLRQGGDCPGTNPVSCHDEERTDDSDDAPEVTMSWFNNSTLPEQVFYIQSGIKDTGDSDDTGSFTLAWTPDVSSAPSALRSFAVAVGASLVVLLCSSSLLM